MDNRGLIHYYYGDGKGKTTAALGLALRYAGQGGRVVIVQFLKNTACGEIESFLRFDNVTVLRGICGEGFAFSMSTEQLGKTKSIHEENLKKAIEIVGKEGLLILDEATDAVETDTLDENMLKTVVAQKPENVEMVITGHAPAKWLIESADYVTEMKKQKHPFDSGIIARIGIEY